MTSFPRVAALAAILAIPAASLAQQISSLSPAEVAAGSPQITLTVDGSGFVASSTVIWRFGGLFSPVPLQTTFVSAARLTAIVPADLLTVAASIPVAVRNVVDGVTTHSPPRNFVITSGMSIASCPADAVPGQPYQFTFTATGGTPPLTWDLTQGALPAGLTLSADGVISGTAAAEGVTQFTVRVRDSAQRTATRPCSLTVTTTPQQTLTLNTLSPNQLAAGHPGGQLTLFGTGFTAGARVVWNFGSGTPVPLASQIQSLTTIVATLPAGLLTTPGEFPVAVEVPSGTAGEFIASNSLIFRVAQGINITTPCPLPEASINSFYSTRVEAAGGTPPLRFEIAGGALPPGLDLAQDGGIAGIPAAAGLFTFTLRARDVGGNPGDRECSLRVRGPFQLSPAVISFRAIAGAAPPAPQNLSILGDQGSPLLFQVFPASTNWLHLSLLAPQLPTVLRLTVDPRGLAPGDYQAQIRVEVQGANPPVQNAFITLSVEPPAPEFSVRPNSLFIGAARDETAPRLRHFDVLARGRGPVQLQTTIEFGASSGWLDVAPVSAQGSDGTPVSFRARVSPAGLAAGVHRALIRITPVGTAESLELPVVLTISTGPDRLELSYSGITVDTIAGAPPGPRKFTIVSRGTSRLQWNASVSTTGGGTWLSVSPASSGLQPNEPIEAELGFDIAGLAPGQYFGEVRVEAPGADNSPRLLGVVLNVVPAPSPGKARIAPANLVFTAQPNSPSTAPQTISVTNPAATAATLDFSVSGEAGLWNISLNGNRLLAPGETREIVVQAIPGTRAAGIYRSNLALHVSSDSHARTSELVLAIASASACTPTTLLPSALSLPGGFSQLGGAPLGLDVRVWDNCGNPMDAGGVSLRASTGSPSGVPLHHAGGGRWTGTWNVEETTATGLAVEITAEDPARGLRGTTSIAGFIEGNSAMPVISQDGIVSTASFFPGPLAPGGLFAIFGAGLAAGSTESPGFPLPDTLSGTQVEIGGRTVPLYFAGQGQVNGMAPFGLIANVLHQVAVIRGNRRSGYAEIPFAVGAPSVFTVDRSGRGQAIVVDGLNPTVIADSANPVSRPGIVTIYCEGLGLVNQPLQAGQPVPASPLSQTLLPVEVTIGGQPARVTFSGLTPFFSGLYQINAELTAEMPAGDAVPVVVRAAGQPSRTTTIAIR